MSKILLSFCVPTYNRPERVYKTIKDILSLQSDEIEIVISDDNPSSNRTQEAMNKIQDPRLKYFRNKKNLRFDANMLITIKKANGEFLYILMDDDEVEMKTVPWILKQIKENKNLTQICGTTGIKNPKTNDIEIYIKNEDRILSKGYESLIKLLFYYDHDSGIVLKKSILDLNKAKKYVGFLWIHYALVAQALIAGNTLCSSKIFAYMCSSMEESDQPLIKGRKYWHPIGVLNRIKYQFEILYDITKEVEKKRKIRKIIRSKLRHLIFGCLFSTLLSESTIFKSLRAFLDGLSIIITIKQILKLPSFWINIVIDLLSSLKNRLFK